MKPLHYWLRRPMGFNALHTLISIPPHLDFPSRFSWLSSSGSSRIRHLGRCTCTSCKTINHSKDNTCMWRCTWRCTWRRHGKNVYREDFFVELLWPWTHSRSHSISGQQGLWNSWYISGWFWFKLRFDFWQQRNWYYSPFQCIVSTASVMSYSDNYWNRHHQHHNWPPSFV